MTTTMARGETRGPSSSARNLSAFLLCTLAGVEFDRARARLTVKFPDGNGLLSVVCRRGTVVDHWKGLPVSKPSMKIMEEEWNTLRLSIV